MEQNKLLIYLELIWWVATLIIAYLVILPILNNIGWNYPFLSWNIAYIILFVTYTRYTFLLKNTFLAKNKRLRIFLFFFTLPYLFLGIESVWGFQAFIDNDGAAFDLAPLVETSISDAERENLFNYIHTETMFFGIGALLAGVLLAIRIAISFFRERNLGTI